MGLMTRASRAKVWPVRRWIRHRRTSALIFLRASLLIAGRKPGPGIPEPSTYRTHSGGTDSPARAKPQILAEFHGPAAAKFRRAAGAAHAATAPHKARPNARGCWPPPP